MDYSPAYIHTYYQRLCEAQSDKLRTIFDIILLNNYIHFLVIVNACIQLDNTRIISGTARVSTKL